MWAQFLLILVRVDHWDGKWSSSLVFGSRSCCRESCQSSDVKNWSLSLWSRTEFSLIHRLMDCRRPPPPPVPARPLLVGTVKPPPPNRHTQEKKTLEVCMIMLAAAWGRRLLTPRPHPTRLIQRVRYPIHSVCVCVRCICTSLHLVVVVVADWTNQVERFHHMIITLSFTQHCWKK